MASSSLFFFGLALLTVAAASPARIIGGDVVPIEWFPSVVQVESFQQSSFWLHQCGGSILNAIHVISAAHCFDGRNYAPENRRIRAGTATKESGGVVLYVEQAFNHPSFGQNGNDGDITVVRLVSAFRYNNRVGQMPIIAPGFTVPENMFIFKVGWGVTSTTTAERSQQLRSVQTLTVNQEACRQNYASLQTAPVVTDNMFCAGSTDADSCDGDSGGPVILSNLVIGIMSWGNGCTLQGFPGVNTAVSPYTNWILEIVTSVEN